MVITEKTFAEAPEEVKIPHELEYVWDWYRELDATRQPCMMGFSAITHTEITNWSEGMGVSVTPFERRCIIAIDNAYRVHCSKKKE